MAVPELLPDVLAREEVAVLPLVGNLAVHFLRVGEVTEPDVVKLDQPKLQRIDVRIERPWDFRLADLDALQISMKVDEHAFLRAVAVLEHQIELRSEEHASELQSLMRISYAVFCWQTKTVKTVEISQTRQI